MNNERSTNQKLEDMAMIKANQEKVSVAEVYAQMVIDDLTYRYRKNQLEDLIDKSLDEKDKESFYKYSEEYNRLRGLN